MMPCHKSALYLSLLLVLAGCGTRSSDETGSPAPPAEVGHEVGDPLADTVSMLPDSSAADSLPSDS